MEAKQKMIELEGQASTWPLARKGPLITPK
jgi:hypothetical protein